MIDPSPPGRVASALDQYRLVTETVLGGVVLLYSWETLWLLP